MRFLKRNMKLLKQVAINKGTTPQQIIDDFIIELWMSTNDLFPKIAETGLFLDYEIIIKPRIANPTVSGVIIHSMALEDSEVQKIRDAQIEKDFQKLDKMFKDRRANLRKWCAENE